MTRYYDGVNKYRARSQTMNTVGAAASIGSAYMYIHLHTYVMFRYTRTYIIYVCVCVCIQGVPGGMCKTLGECSLC